MCIFAKLIICIMHLNHDYGANIDYYFKTTMYSLRKY
nr:MAG TPA: hypothetical protein [Caudoviricetes sp.]